MTMAHTHQLQLGSVLGVKLICGRCCGVLLDNRRVCAAEGGRLHHPKRDALRHRIAQGLQGHQEAQGATQERLGAFSLSLSLTSRRRSCLLTLVWLVLRRKQRSPSGTATTGRSWSILWTARYSRRGGTR